MVPPLYSYLYRRTGPLVASLVCACCLFAVFCVSCSFRVFFFSHLFFLLPTALVSCDRGVRSKMTHVVGVLDGFYIKL